MARTRHFIALDSLRGVCALLVCLFHFPATGVLLETGFIRHSTLFVDFFFVLSGFVIAANYIDRLQAGPSLMRFFWLRIGRLYPLHLAVFLAYFAFELARFASGAGDAFTGDKAVETIPTNLLLIHSLGIHDDASWNRPSWSISCELFAYVAFALSTVAAGKLRYVAYAMLTAGSFFMLAHFNDGKFLATADYGYFRCLMGFFAGVFVWRAWKGIDGALEAPTQALASWTFVEIAAIAGVVAYVSLVPQPSLLNFAAPAVFGGAVLVFAFEKGAVSSALRIKGATFVGLLSYSIYMVHQFLIDRLLNVAKVGEKLTGMELTRIGPDGFIEFAGNGVWADATAAAFLVLTVAVSWVTYRLIEAPARDWFRDHAPRAAKAAAS